MVARTLLLGKNNLLVIRMDVGCLTQWGSSWPRERVCERGGIRKNCEKVKGDIPYGNRQMMGRHRLAKDAQPDKLQDRLHLRGSWKHLAAHSRKESDFLHGV